MRYKYIIFDNDGVNIDSEHIAMRVMDECGRVLVLRYKPDADLPENYIYRTYPGTSTDRIVDTLIRNFNLPRDQIRKAYKLPEDVDVAVSYAELVTLETNSRFKALLKAIPGATPALMKIRNMFGPENMALATTSPAERMDICLDCAVDAQTLENARLAEIFPAGPRRRSGYGHPNKYDETFGALGWNPKDTIIVEDSASGVQKAKAGRPDTPVIGTVAATFYEDKPAQAKVLLGEGASIVISSMADLPHATMWLQADMAKNARPNFEAQIYTSPAGRSVLGRSATPSIR
ncbi:MAG: HAD family phosphatase [Alphaproteobacteria bacterium]|nr:HAD family phosphatase [Alphaproteobacteria bacterium]